MALNGKVVNWVGDRRTRRTGIDMAGWPTGNQTGKLD